MFLKYFDYNNIFLTKNIIEFLKYISIYNYIIKLKRCNQLFLIAIYNIKIIKLEILKTCIKINLINNFIWFFKLFAKIIIFFN